MSKNQMKKSAKKTIKERKKSVLLQEAEAVFRASHVAVIFEDMKDNFKLLSEGQIAIVERMDTLEGRFDSLEERFGGFESRFDSFQTEMYEFRDAVTEDLDKVNNSLDKIENHMDNVDNHLDNIDNRLDKIENRLDSIEAELEDINQKLDQKADKAWAAERIHFLEQQIQVIKDKIGIEY